MSQEEFISNNEQPKITDFSFLEMGYAYKLNPKADEYVGFKRNIFGGPEIIQPTREKQNNTGVYRSAFLYNTKDPYESHLYGNFFMDFDGDQSEKHTREESINMAREDMLYAIWFLYLKLGFNLPMEAFRIFFSGMKGFHLVIPSAYFGYQPHKNLDEHFKWVAHGINERSPNKTLDLGIYEKRRLFRLENSIHQGTGLHKIPLQYDEAVNLPLEEIEKLAQKPRVINYPESFLVKEAQEEWQRYMDDLEGFKKMQKERRGGVPSIAKGETPDIVQEIIDRGPMKGVRNETAAALTSFWKNQGYTEDEIFDLLLDWNDGSLPDREIKTTMKSILARDLNYGLNRFKSLAEGEIASYEEDYKEYKEYKRKGRF